MLAGGKHVVGLSDSKFILRCWDSHAVLCGCMDQFTVNRDNGSPRKAGHLWGGTPTAPPVPALWVQPHWGRVEVVEVSVMWSCGHGKAGAGAEMNLTLEFQQQTDLRTGLLH